ncbi:hypothetical protein PoB_005862300 [Plakobranchus ocellatus]|uniref:Secreted protein n=1 Tax=Plakobranchus ocellatus TaxID=259542 RepID=A0AAV4CKE6_9GAST|nr:hypothetical protein PoB_005862300 [Plakobranchus ocellatus]
MGFLFGHALMAFLNLQGNIAADCKQSEFQVPHFPPRDLQGTFCREFEPRYRRPACRRPASLRSLVVEGHPSLRISHGCFSYF